MHFVGTHYSFVVRFCLFVCECRQEEQVQTLVAEISGYRSAIQSALPCLLIMFWGKWCGGCVVVDILGVGDDDFITDTVQNERNKKMYVSEVWPLHYLFSSRMQSRRDARIFSNMSDRISSNQKAKQFSCSDLYRLCHNSLYVDTSIREKVSGSFGGLDAMGHNGHRWSSSTREYEVPSASIHPFIYREAFVEMNFDGSCRTDWLRSIFIGLTGIRLWNHTSWRANAARIPLRDRCG